jgi:hypothetical protein
VTANASFLARLRETDDIPFAEQWRRWRGDRLLPRRAELDLSSIRRLLGSVMLFELHAEEVALVNVAGTALRALHIRHRRGFCLPRHRRRRWRAG